MIECVVCVYDTKYKPRLESVYGTKYIPRLECVYNTKYIPRLVCVYDTKYIPHQHSNRVFFTHSYPTQI